MNKQQPPSSPANPESRITDHGLSLNDKFRNMINLRPEVLFAYLHGSSLTCDNPHDIDIAIYLSDREYMRLQHSAALILDYQMPLEMILGKESGAPVDIQMLNTAPLGFRYRVSLQGQLLCDRDSQRREEFELLTRKEYFDFRPRVLQYLSETIV